MRGVRIEPGDLDVHVDDATLAGRLLADHLVEPVTQMRGWVADNGGRAFAGVLVEWLAGARPSGLPRSQAALSAGGEQHHESTEPTWPAKS